MAPRHPSGSSPLAACHGFAVLAADGFCGAVETPLFPPDCAEPDFLVLRLGEGAARRLAYLPVTLVEAVDAAARIVTVAAEQERIESLPEHLPLAR